MPKCYLGSTNRVKVAATKQVLKQFEVVGLPVNSQVSAQPLSDLETIEGAKNRALALPKDGLRIGLEAGVQLHHDMLFLVNWGVLIDENHRCYYAGGTRIPLPEFMKEELLVKKIELADVMDSYMSTANIREKQGAIGVFTQNVVKRKDIFIHIVKLLYGQYLRGKEQ
jgi:inosine/xanthosine triphosphatase